MKQNNKARVIITFDCPRNCTYCCNKYSLTMKNANIINDLTMLSNYQELMITGGEVALFNQTLDIVKTLKFNNPSNKIYVYTAYYSDILLSLLPYIDGIHYSLHANYNYNDDDMFITFQEQIKDLMNVSDEFNKSLRLFIHPDIKYYVEVLPFIWNRVEVGKIMSPDVNCLPTDEDLIVYTNGLK